MPEAPPWPPKKEDLERLYLTEKLSAAKIARVYGQKYKSAKIAGRLSRRGYSCVVRRLKQVENRGVRNGQDHIWRLEICRAEQVRKFLREIKHRHREKLGNAGIALEFPSWPTKALLTETKQRWKFLVAQIEAETKLFVEDAGLALDARARVS
ncbi:MAG: hypothetical protein JRM80_00445 [Nitrososphaerota archaeon]|nr:hypothetical protein [Nitrososphaerota archaeon]